jgi:multiple antibiotic resistance protein
MELTTAMLAAFAALFPLMNPVGNTPIFFSITAGDTPGYRHRQAVKAAIDVFVILAICLFFGRYILAMFGLSVPVLRMAGGLVVGHVGWGLLEKSPCLAADAHAEAVDKVDVSLSPMALPIMAGPGAISVVISLGAGSVQPMTLAGYAIGVALVTLLNYVCLVLGEPLVKRLGRNGMDAFNKVLGFLVLAIGIDVMVSGLHELIKAGVL